MHPNAQTLQRFYTAFNQLDHATMRRLKTRPFR